MSLAPVGRQFATFAAVGVAATLAHVVVALSAHELGGLSPLSANAIGYGAAVSISYFGNARMTFGREAMRLGQFSRFLLVSLAALALNQGLVFLLTDIARLPYAAALVPVVIVVPLFTFALSKVWAFVDRGSTRTSG